MKDINNIEDWYRDELDNFNVKPDDGVWNSLSDELDANMVLTEENIGEWYKREVNKLEERPDYTVWEKLATKLDTASVWDKLVVSLNKYDKFIWWRNTILKGSAILLLLGGSYLTYYNYSNNLNTTDKTDLSIKTNESKNDLIDPPKSTRTPNDKRNKISVSNNIENNQSKNNSSANTFGKTSPTNSSISSTINSTKKSLLSKKKTKSSNSNLYASTRKEEQYNPIKINNFIDLKTEENPTIFKEIERRNITTEDISHIVSSSDFLVKKEKNRIVFNTKRFSSYTSYGLYARRFYLGINAGIKKQGLITNVKESSTIANANQVEYLDFGGSFGATAGYILSDNFNLEANINAINTSGYKRRFNAEGYSFDEKLNLNYSTINLLVKKMNTKSTFDNKVYSTNIIGGVYASILTSSNSTINENKVNNDTYSNTDLGIVLGIEQDRYLSKTLVITPGIRYNQGLTNIANDNNPYKSARNFSLEFNIGLKYIFLKTSK